MSETVFVVLADYGDDWEEQNDPEYYWTVAGSHPAKPCHSLFPDLAIYGSLAEARWRSGCILDHATSIEEWPLEVAKKVVAETRESGFSTPFIKRQEYAIQG